MPRNLHPFFRLGQRVDPLSMDSTSSLAPIRRRIGSSLRLTLAILQTPFVRALRGFWQAPGAPYSRQTTAAILKLRYVLSRVRLPPHVVSGKRAIVSLTYPMSDRFVLPLRCRS